MGENQDKITFEEAYHENGKLWYKHQYLNGEYHGEQLYYWENGQLKYKWQCLNGDKHGEQIGYFDYGELWYKNYYINGEGVSQEEWIKYNRNLKLNTIWNKIKIK